MNSAEANTSWIEQKSRLKKQFTTITDNDLLFSEDIEDEMFVRLQAKLGKTKEELHTLLSSL